MKQKNRGEKRSKKDFEKKDKKKSSQEKSSRKKQSAKPETPFQDAGSLLVSRSVVGVILQADDGFALQTTNKRTKEVYPIRLLPTEGWRVGDLVRGRFMPNRKTDKIVVDVQSVLGEVGDPTLFSEAIIEEFEIPHVFSDEALAEARAAKPVKLEDRADLRDLPFVTIDGADARDFDDAVFAKKNSDGWHIVVAIADVAHYVKPGSALDTEAQERGNSVYLPDRVVPMLPEELSNDLCSLRPNEDRACLAAHLLIDREGNLREWKFVRGLMRSRARLIYEDVQAAMDGSPNEEIAPLMKGVIKPLFGAYACLMTARMKRGTLDFELPERKVILDKAGSPTAIPVRERLSSHRLIEEFMITANVAAASALQRQNVQTLYRIHDAPSEIRLEALDKFLESCKLGHLTSGLKDLKNRPVTSKTLAMILAAAAKTRHAEAVNEIVLRTQAKAVYDPENIGHFGLALKCYAHFTSPIRRYADLIVHRGLIRAHDLGTDGLTESEEEKLSFIGQYISATERRADTAEREVVDRYAAHFLTQHIGSIFDARIKGVIEGGIFAALDATGTEVLIHASQLPKEDPKDFFYRDANKAAMIGSRSGRVYRLGDPLVIRLDAVDRLTGKLSFSFPEEEAPDLAVSGSRTKPAVCAAG